MEYWEVVKELKDDPKKKFEAKMKSKDFTVRMTVKKGLGGYYHFEIFNGERLIDQSLGSGGFNGNVCLELDWKPVHQTVTWQEAIQEFAKGKKLIVKFHNQEWTLSELVELPNYLDVAITKGEWYVED